MPEQWIIDAVEEDAGNVPLDLLAAPFSATRFNTPTPGIDPRWAQPADADGDRLASVRYLNREISGSLEIVPTPGPGASADAQAALRRLADKLAKVNRQGGTLRRVLPSGDAITFDLVTADPIDPPWDFEWDAASTLHVDVRFTAMPFWRGAEVAYSTHTESSLPVLVFTEVAPAGDVPALGRLVLTDVQGVDRGWVTWGLQCHTYDPAPTAALFYEAERLTPMGTAGVTTVAGASGGGSNNVLSEASLTPNWAAVMSTQAAGGGAHLTHVGGYRVFARIWRPALNWGEVSVAFEWSEGDFHAYVRNDATTLSIFDGAGVFSIVDLGLVDISPSSTRWEGRVIAKSTFTGGPLLDAMTIDCLFLVPTERSGEAGAIVRPPTSTTTYKARDGFAQAGGGSLVTQTPPVGGAWSGFGSATDFAQEPSQRLVTRSAATDTSGTGRWDVTTPVLTDTVVQANIFGRLFVSGVWQGITARFTDARNHVSLYRESSITYLVKYVAGVGTFLQGEYFPHDDTQWYTMSLQIDSSGNYAAWLYLASNTTPGEPIFVGFDSDLATGGPLASGRVGLFDYGGTASETRLYDQFFAWSPPADAAIFANRSVRFAFDGVTRDADDGSVSTAVTRDLGDRLYVPPAGSENRPVRVIAKAVRSIGGAIDSGLDDLSGRLYVTPRGLIVP